MKQLSLREKLSSRLNDYRHLEKLYQEATGEELVRKPFSFVGSQIAEMPLSVSIVVAAYNAEATIIQCLKAIELSSFNHKYAEKLEVVIVVDGATDGTWQKIQQANLNLNYKAVLQENTGQYQAINTGLCYAEGDIIISTDADMILHYFTIEELMKRHAVIKDALFIGFRHDIMDNDPKLSLERFNDSFYEIEARFFCDNRIFFHWPCWPYNLCRQTDDLKRLSGTDLLWITEECTPDGDCWTLPRMVYGCLFSLPRATFNTMGAYHQDFKGWAWGDTSIGALAYGMGNHIIPVYSAVGAHIYHEDRSPNKWTEFKRNHQVLQKMYDSPILEYSSESFRGRKNPVVEIRENCHLNRTSSIPFRSGPKGLDCFFSELQDRACYYYSVSEDEELMSIDPESAGSYQIRSLYAKHQYEAALALAEQASDQTWQGLCLAAKGDFNKAKKIMEQTSSCDGLWRYIMKNEPASHLRRGQKYFKQGYYEIAARDYEAALIQHAEDQSLVREWEKICKLVR